VRLTFVEIRDYRSIFVDDAGRALHLDLAEGANTFVGRNNCGKSNVLRAISLAMDPHHEFRAEDDTPGPRPFSHPIITLGFSGDLSNSDHNKVLAAAGAFEQSLGVAPSATRAARGEVVMQVSFIPTPDGVRRDETVLTDAQARPSNLDEQQVLLEQALVALRDAVRFVLISSGESIESVLEGNFREILHSVVRERLRQEFDTAERSRQTYIDGLKDSLLRPLRDRLAADVGGMFPEIDGILLTPDVSTIERTLSNVDVSLDDIVTTPLAGKGTGVRGGLLVAMLSYLALNATRGMVFAVEEPEAFLHPASQEDLRDHLEQLAAAAGVTLLVTSHSPFIVTRSPIGRVFCLAKDRDGRTRLSQSAAGSSDHAPLIAGLLRAITLESLLKSVTEVPAGTRAVVLVEGEGDQFCFELAARVVGQENLLDGLCFRPTDGTIEMIAKAVIAKAALDLPIVVVTDNDEPGRKAKNTLVGNMFGFGKKQVVTYGAAFGPQWEGFPVEAEDLFPPELIEGFVAEHGDAVVDGTKRRPDGAFHYDFGQAAKELLSSWLEQKTQPEHVVRWIDMLLQVRTRAGLTVPTETAAELVAAAPASPSPAGRTATKGQALIVSGRHDYARYQATSALILDSDQQLAGGVTHIGFYAKAIQPHVATILADHPNLLFNASTVEQLRATGKTTDERVAAIIEDAIRSSPDLMGQSHRVLLLSRVDDEATLVLDQPVMNTKTINGRPVAWTVGSKVVPTEALAKSPTTTDELDAALENLPDS
jgi:putative ATP-dependent endonuclease of OLD family